MEVSLELERTIAGNSKKPMMPQRRVFRVGFRIWRVVGLRVQAKGTQTIKIKPTNERTAEYEEAMTKAARDLPPYSRKPNKPRDFEEK